MFVVSFLPLPFGKNPSTKAVFLKLIPFIPSPKPNKASEIAEFTSIYSFILISLGKPCMKNGFIISHFTFPK